MNILVVEDHDDLREATVDALEGFGYSVQGADCGEAMDELLADFYPDVLLLDLNLPGEDGLNISRRLRATMPDLGIVMITARNQASDVMRGYGNGADIYVTKPASPEELHAAIQALARRLKPIQPASPINLDTHAMQLAGPQGMVDLSDGDSHLLVALALARNHRLETWQLLEVLHKQPDAHDKRALTVQIVRLRKKLLEAGASEPTIKAIRGTGYQLCVNLQIKDSGR
jgi:DNA-binding response OmpR family regulator